MSARILVVSLAGAAIEGTADALIARGHDVTAVNGLVAARRELAGHALVIAEAGAGDAVEACRRLRGAAPAGLPIIAVVDGHDVEQRIALTEAGVDDILARPFDGEQLELLVQALLSRARPVVPDSAGPGTSTVPAGGHGRVICFAAAKGGAGTTTLAVNVAVAIAQRGEPVAIADLDFHHGQVATHLDLMPRRTTAELAVASGDAEELERTVAEVRLRHASGLDVYPAPQRPDQASAIDADHVIELIRALRGQHPLLIVDAGSVPATRALALLGLADESVIVVTPDIPGLRALTGTLAVMSDSGIAGEQNLFVVNRTFAGQPIGNTDIERSVGVAVSLEVPFDGEACVRAVNEGQPVVALSPRSPVALAVGRLAALVAGGEAVGRDGEGRRGLLGGLLGRRGS